MENQDYCPPCGQQASECARCDALVMITHPTARGNEVCTACSRAFYGNCVRCGELERNEALYWVTDCNQACPSCVEDYYVECDGCSDLIDSGNLCEVCQAHREYSASELIHDYSYKPWPQFHGDGPLFLGLELEINTPWDSLPECAQIATEHLGPVGYLKEDSSLDDGFEIVTHPMSYEWALERFPWRMLEALELEGCHGDDAGLHVHISRAAFASPGHVYRWMKLIHRNRDQVITLARRESDEWAAFTDSDRANVKHFTKDACGYRYRAINCTNTNTFELRIFAASLDRQEVAAALALAAASVEYTRALTIVDIRAGAWEWSAFAEWLDEHAEYAPLSREMEALACAC